MSKPVVFVSSTYVDLRDLRESVSQYLVDSGYEAIVFEKGGISYDHTRPIDESCYKNVKTSDVFVLIIGGMYGSLPPARRGRRGKARLKFNSITKREYIVARDEGIPIFTFVQADVLAEYKTWTANRSNVISYAHVDNPQVFSLIHDIYGEELNNPIFPYQQVSDIIRHLTDQMAGLIKDSIADRRGATKVPVVRINGFKLFYFRSNLKLTFNALSKKTGLDRRVLKNLERVKQRDGKLTSTLFQKCDQLTLKKLEESLNCWGKLGADRPDDFLTQYMMFYQSHRGKHRSSNLQYGQTELKFETRAVVFDFDGTLTQQVDHEKTTWEKIWVSLGYTVNDCAELHKQFRQKLFSHQKWCDITSDKFRAKGFNKEALRRLALQIQLLPGTAETIIKLRNNGVRLYILSGSIRELINLVLGDLNGSFEEVRANDMVFDSTGFLQRINGTPFDFEGKALFLKNLIEQNHFSPMDVLFVGNSCNDVWASESGARTLCVNPHFTDPDNPEHWTYAIREMSDLSRILEYVNI
jgi:HAD superfamily phosphoserine phosphatase-like hydrolase